MIRRLLGIAFALVQAMYSQARKQSSDADLKFVVYISRHGVPSPNGKPSQYNPYSAAAWPAWDVPPGYLTEHGYRLMEIFGAYDRMVLANDGLLRSSGCDDAASVTIYTDSDQRTRETGKALASGAFPGCNVPIQSLSEGINDPLFHPVPARQAPVNARLGRLCDRRTHRQRPTGSHHRASHATCVSG